jgi:uncharacterized protein YciI
MVFPAHRVNRDADITEMFDCFAQAEVYLAVLHPTPQFGTEPDLMLELSRQHFIYLWELEHAGKLFAAGPVERSDATDPLGMLVVIETSKEAAIQLLEDEPFQKAGWVDIMVQSWNVQEGHAASIALLLKRLVTGDNVSRVGDFETMMSAVVVQAD